jgi:hypothetical protein
MMERMIAMKHIVSLALSLFSLWNQSLEFEHRVSPHFPSTRPLGLECPWPVGKVWKTLAAR